MIRVTIAALIAFTFVALSNTIDFDTDGMTNHNQARLMAQIAE